MQIQSPEAKAGLQARLRRIEGQTRGIQKMLDEERDCRDILQQLNAVHAAIERATAEFVRVYAKDCMLNGAHLAPNEREVLVDELLDLMARVK
jgi:DNA-binding FrmR family transcriptional regulator